MSGTEAEKKPQTYITVRFKDAVKKDGTTPRKLVENFFWNGGKDKNGNPVLSNEKLTALVTSTGKLVIERNDKEGKIARDADGNVLKPVARVDLANVIGGVQAGLASKELAAGQATVTGPKTAELIKLLEPALAKGLVKREELKAEKLAKSAEAPSPQ